MQIDNERMHAGCKHKLPFIAIDIAEHLVLQNKIPFRTAHKIVGALVSKAASKGNIPLAKLEFADAASVINAHKVDIKADQLMKIINGMTPEKSLETENHQAHLTCSSRRR